MKKVLVLDIDGTLTNSQKVITGNTKTAIIEAMKRGHKVMLASGRPTPGMKKYATELELANYDGYLLSFNGGKIIHCKTGEIIFQKILPSVVIKSLYKFAIEKGCGLITYLGDDIILATDLDEYIEHEAKINDMKFKKVSNFVDYVSDYNLNKMLMTAPPEKAEVLVEELQEKYKDVLSIYRSEPFFIEIMPKNLDKAASIDRMLTSLGLTKDDAICCGDGFNDKSMIEYAGIGVAMENAQPAVKEVADYITKSNDEDGIVEVIDKFVL